MQRTEAERKAYNAYMRKWRKEHPEQYQAIQLRYLQKKLQKTQAEKKVQDER